MVTVIALETLGQEDTVRLLEKEKRIWEGRDTGTWSDRVVLRLGFWWLPAVPVCLGMAILTFAHHDYLTATKWASMVPVGMVMWGHAWRTSIDTQMAEAWITQVAIRRTAAVSFAILALPYYMQRDWFWVLFMALMAVGFWNYRGHGGGGGGDDEAVPDPKPDSSVSV